MELIFLLLGLVGALYYYLTRNFGYWKKRGIPYVKPVPIFGNLWQSVIMKRNAGDISADAYREFPNEKVVGMFHFDEPVLLIRDPELVYKIFVTDFQYFSDNAIFIDENVDPVLSRNMFFQRGEKWKRTRQMISPAFTMGKIKFQFESINSVGQKLAEYVKKNPDECELKYLMTRFTTEIAATCALGIDGQAFKRPQPQLVKIGQMIFEPSLKSGLIQLLVQLSPTLTKIFRVKMVPDEVPEFFNGILRDVIQYRQVNPPQGRQDIIQYWLDLKKKSQEVARGDVKSDVIVQEMTDDDVLNGCLTFFIEAYESVSMTTAFALYHLAINKDIQDRVKNAIDRVYAENDGKLTFEAISEMTILNNIILEVLRLHPVVMHTMKTCTKDYTLDVEKSEPLTINKNTTVIIPNIGMNHDPKYWENPKKFDPDRFDRLDKEYWKKGLFMPFGDGPRVCIGMRLAYLMAKLGLIHILKDLEVVPSPKTPTEIVQDPRHFISRNKGGLYARFIKRT